MKAICPSGVARCDLAPKYMNIHVWATKTQNFKDHVKKWHDAFGIELVITELACHEFGGAAPSTEQVSAFMSEFRVAVDATAGRL